MMVLGPYADFWAVLGKQIQHNLSTLKRNEFEKFRQAKEGAAKLYNEAFSEQLKESRACDDKYNSLELPKAAHKPRAFTPFV